MARVLEMVERTVARFGPFLDELVELRGLVKDQQAQIEALIGALRERAGKDVDDPADDPAPLLN
jgi:hypothetical protein